MIDLQTYLNNAVAASRQEELKGMDVMLLGELVLKLENIADQTKAIRFDFDDMIPDGLDSWRGIYAELSLHYSKEPRTSVADVLSWCKEAIGKTFEGYKGGDFVMGKQTPIWVANYGESGVSGYKDSEEYTNVGAINVVDGDTVTIITKAFP